MLIRQLKLKLNEPQEAKLNQWFNNLTGVYNWAIKKIENDARDINAAKVVLSVGLGINLKESVIGLN